MPAATKKEAQNVLNAARTKAQHANEARNGSQPDTVEQDAAELHYLRCVRELEEAINDMARFDKSGDDE